jgi:hypothetical protein
LCDDWTARVPMPLPDGAAAEMRVIVEDVERAGVVQK